MKEPKYAKLLLGRNTNYMVDIIHYDTQIVTLRENPKVFNSVSISDVEFDFTDFSGEEIDAFWGCFCT